MSQRGGAVSAALLRSLNARLLYDQLHEKGSTSRVELAHAAGLSKPTVSAALADLEAAGLVTQTGAIEGRPGPAASLYDIQARAGHVVAMDIGRRFIRVALADLRGEILVRRDVKNEARSALDLVAQVDTLARTLAREAGIPWSELVRGVLASPGTFDAATGRFRFAGNLPGWGQRGLYESLLDSLGINLAIHNDINLAVMAEHCEGVARGRQNVVLVSIGTGVGLGMVLNGELYTGSTGAAGEAGYLPFGGDPESVEPEPRRKNLGGMEMAVSARAVQAEAQAAGLQARTAKDVFDAAWKGQKEALKVVDTVGRRVGELITAVAALIDPELVVLAGGIGQNLPLLRSGIEARMKELSPFRPRIEASALTENGVLRGALLVASREARDLLFEQRLPKGR